MTLDEKMNGLRDAALIKKVIDQAADGLADQLLATCADQEYRLCLLELDIN